MFWQTLKIDTPEIGKLTQIYYLDALDENFILSAIRSDLLPDTRIKISIPTLNRNLSVEPVPLWSIAQPIPSPLKFRNYADSLKRWTGEFLLPKGFGLCVTLYAPVTSSEPPRGGYISFAFTAKK